jgi:hypothetical protein
VDRLKQWWSSYHFQGSSSFILAHKLKVLKYVLRNLNKKVLGNVEWQNKLLWDELRGLQTVEEDRALRDEEKAKVISDFEMSTLM